MENEKMENEKIAELCHEINRVYCESVGDNSQKPWNKAPNWQRESAINGVKFHLEDGKFNSRLSHENWLREKEKDGWVYGEVKDVEKKTHPCMIPYDELPEFQRFKDKFFVTIVKVLKDGCE